MDLKRFFLINVFLAVCVYGLILSNTPVPDWVRFYAADFLCMPIVLSICLWGVRAWKSDANLRLSLFNILSVVGFYSVYFEVYLPPRNQRYTADIWDVGMYLGGALLFYLVQELNRKNNNSVITSGRQHKFLKKSDQS